MNSKMLAFAGLGFEMVAILVISAYGGKWLDQHYDWKGMATAGLVILGLAGWIVHILYMLKKFEKDDNG